MFQIVGSRTNYEYGHEVWTGNKLIEKIVATFDSERAAKKYVKEARLKTPDGHRPFRLRSLLEDFEFAEVQEVEKESPPPHNPKVPQPIEHHGFINNES